MKYFFYVVSLVLLIYLVIPGPDSIKDFPALPNSEKSTLSGDTYQVPNVIAYFSNNYRNLVTNFYKESYQKNTLFPFEPLRLNHPPEFAFTAIKDQTHSTYLEEYYYPLRDSLYVNGLEPFENGRPRYVGAVKFNEEGGLWDTKVTLRYYPSNVVARIITWIGIVVCFVLLWKLTRNIIFSR